MDHGGQRKMFAIYICAQGYLVLYLQVVSLYGRICRTPTLIFDRGVIVSLWLDVFFAGLVGTRNMYLSDNKQSEDYECML
jgi:hypothetical protein